MTLNLAIKFKTGVLLATDRRVTYDIPLMKHEEKIEVVGNFALTGSGLTGPLDNILNHIKNSDIASITSHDEFLKLCEDTMWNYHKRYAERIQENDEDEDWTLLLVSKDKITHINKTGWSEEEKNYATDGSSDLYAEYILKQYYKQDMKKDDVINLAIYILIESSKMDPSVGGKPCLYVLDDSGVNIIDETKIDEIINNISIDYLFENPNIKIVKNIVEKRRIINNLFEHKYTFKLFLDNEKSIIDLQNICKNEGEFTNNISSLCNLIDGMSFPKEIKEFGELSGSINKLDFFLKQNQFNSDELINNFRRLMTLRSKKCLYILIIQK